MLERFSLFQVQSIDEAESKLEEGGDATLSSEQQLPGMLEQLLRKLATIMG
jgi:hypothetical protein